jgi:hypothetical protein
MCKGKGKGKSKVFLCLSKHRDDWESINPGRLPEEDKEN